MNQNLSDGLLNDVMRVRANKPLTEPEAHKAAVLANAFASQIRINGNYDRVLHDLELAQEDTVYIDEDPGRALRMLSAPSMIPLSVIQRLFATKIMPLEVQALLDDQNQPGFDKNRIKEVIEPLLQNRREELEAKRDKAHQEYLNMQHELEATAVENSIAQSH